MTPDLFATERPRRRQLDDGAVLLHGFAADEAAGLLAAIDAVAAAAPFRQMTTPGGFRMSVEMTNTGPLGWVSDRRGYRYDRIDPETGRPWPGMPDLLRQLAIRAADAAGFAGFDPNSALINRYVPGTKLSLHQDRDEADLQQPIVSVSLGLAAKFLWGGAARTDPVRRIVLEHGDVVVWGGPSRLFFHGIAPLAQGSHAATGACRYNLTFRNAG
jgi:alkylated DNA repair protein (DNA oxidative demethylase)